AILSHSPAFHTSLCSPALRALQTRVVRSDSLGIPYVFPRKSRARRAHLLLAFWASPPLLTPTSFNARKEAYARSHSPDVEALPDDFRSRHRSGFHAVDAGAHRPREALGARRRSSRKRRERAPGGLLRRRSARGQI